MVIVPETSFIVYLSSSNKCVTHNTSVNIRRKKRQIRLEFSFALEIITIIYIIVHINPALSIMSYILFP